MRRMLTLATTAACALAVGVADGSSDGPTLLVDDDRQQCRNADFTTIGAAVAAASPGDEILVCAGLYHESVVVTKSGLTLRAHHAAGGDCFDPAAPAPDSTRKAIVSAGPTGTAFMLAADDVRLDGFVVRSSNPGIATAAGFSGYRVERNFVFGNMVGLGLASSGAETSLVRHNCFRDNGPAGGILALAQVGGPLVGARIDHNEFFRNAFGVRMGASRDVTIDHNNSLADGTWMRNGGVGDVAIIHNEVGAGPGPGIAFFPFGGQAGGAPNVDVVIAHNRVAGRGSDGFQALAGSSLVDSLIAHNQIVHNGRDGIRIEAGANARNAVVHNTLTGNAAHDCHDDTMGSGTGGTANTWEGNDGETQNRPGLCRGATVVPGPQ